jgi:hypothetical protein
MTYKPHQLGTVEYYEEHFSDILCDLGDTPVVGASDYSANCLQGLVNALKSWKDYHSQAAERYQQFSQDLYTLIQEN